METLWSDVRLAIRSLLRDRGFAAVAILTLALGIGANTAIFSVVNGVVLRPLAYREPDRLVVINEVVPSLAHIYPTLPVNQRHFREWRARCRSLEQIAIADPIMVSLTAAGEPVRLDAARVSASLFDVLGVRPALGRAFLPEEELAGGDRVVILSDSLWRRMFRADPDLPGRTIELDGAAHVVVGILPPSFRFPATTAKIPPRVDVLRPLVMAKDPAPFGEFNHAVLGLLRRGATIEQAVSEMNPIQAEFARMVPGKLELKAALTPLAEQTTGSVRRGLLVLLCAVGAVLLIVCVNLANLLFARATARGRDAAIRSALGASRWRIVRQALTETLVLGAAGGAAGIALAYYAIGLLVRTAPVDLPRLDEVSVDARALVFAVAIAALSSVLFGLLPAWRLTRSDPQRELRANSRSATEGRHGLRLRGVLVSVEVCLSAMLLIVAGLLLASFVNLMKAPQGFQPERVITAEVNLPASRYGKHEDRVRLYGELVRKLEAIPGATSAALVSTLPLQGEDWGDVIHPLGDAKPTFQQPLAYYRFISPGYFRTMGIQVEQGRAFEDADNTRNVAIVAARAAQRVWQGENPLGRRFHRGNLNEPPFELVGVVGDTRIKMESSPLPIVYVPYSYRTRTTMALVLRTAMEPAAAAASLRRAVAAVDPQAPVSRVRTLREMIGEVTARRRFQMQFSTAFAAAALLLAGVGIFGVVSYSVAQRRAEIAIRMALGAAPADVHRLVLREGMTPVTAGLAAGVVAALALGRLVGSLLYGVSAHDPVIIGSVAVLLALVAAAACLLPALRATRGDPAGALRCQ